MSRVASLNFPHAVSIIVLLPAIVHREMISRLCSSMSVGKRLPIRTPQIIHSLSSVALLHTPHAVWIIASFVASVHGQPSSMSCSSTSVDGTITVDCIEVSDEVHLENEVGEMPLAVWIVVVFPASVHSQGMVFICSSRSVVEGEAIRSSDIPVATS